MCQQAGGEPRDLAAGTGVATAQDEDVERVAALPSPEGEKKLEHVVRRPPRISAAVLDSCLTGRRGLQVLNLRNQGLSPALELLLAEGNLLAVRLGPPTRTSPQTATSA